MTDGRIDPTKPVVTGKPKRRKLRNRPEPAQELKDWRPGARKRADARPYPPEVMLEPAGHDREEWTAPHNDDGLWMLQLADAFGTRSASLVYVFLHHLKELCGKSHWDAEAQQWRLNEHEFSAALALVNGLKPRNEMEAAHAAQMVAVHLLTMKVTARAIRYDYDTRTAAVAGKLARTFTLQREAFERLRKPNRTVKQTIKVEKELHQYVHYHRGDAESGRQSDATTAGTATPPKCPALPGSEEARGRIVSFPSGERPEDLPHARRDKSRRSQGGG
jgi:hypothetical protein